MFVTVCEQVSSNCYARQQVNAEDFNKFSGENVRKYFTRFAIFECARYVTREFRNATPIFYDISTVLHRELSLCGFIIAAISFLRRSNVRGVTKRRYKLRVSRAIN